MVEEPIYGLTGSDVSLAVGPLRLIHILVFYLICLYLIMEAVFGVMWNLVEFLLFTVFLIIVFYLLRQHRLNKHLLVNIPPGPKPLPVVGNFGSLFVPPFILKLFVQKHEENERKRASSLSTQVGLTELSKVYGNIYSLFVGSQLVVVLNGYEMVRDALSNHAEAFSDRPDIPLISILTKRKGESRSCIIHHLRTQL